MKSDFWNRVQTREMIPPASWLVPSYGQWLLVTMFIWMLSVLCPVTANAQVKPLPNKGTPFVLSQAERNKDAAILDRLIAKARPGQTTIAIDDMLFKVSTLRAISASLRNPNKNGQTRSTFDPRLRLWPGGNVYYQFDANVSAENRTRFEAACREWEQHANLLFIPRTSQNDYIQVKSSNVNNSFVGMIGGAQLLNMVSWTNKWIICHELAHALGVNHEQCRSDRDSFIQYNPQNVADPVTYAHNFVRIDNSLNQGPYDFESVMHYKKGDFAKPGTYTLEPLPAYSQYLDTIGQRDRLSDLDKAGMAALYGRPPTGLSATVRTPANNSSHMQGSLTSATGSAGGTGLTSVGVGVRRYDASGTTRTGCWDWTNSTWTSNPSSVPVRTASGTTSWSATLPSSSVLVPGRYDIIAFAHSSGTNTWSPAAINVINITASITPPTITISSPAHGSSHIQGSLTIASGTATDGGTHDLGLGMWLVKLDSSGTTVTGHWDWQYNRWVDPEEAPFVYTTSKATTGTTNWSGTLPALTPGRYEIRVTGSGRHSNNIDLVFATPASNTFTITSPVSSSVWNALDVTTGSNNQSRLIWTTPIANGAVWNLDANVNYLASGPNYGPFSGWSPQAVAMGGDNTTRLLWTNTNGQATVWLLDAQGNHSGQSPTFGPFDDWRAVDIATGSDNATRVLWRNGAGQATVWLLDAQGNYTTQGATYGPYGGWAAQRISIGENGRTRLLWTNTNGQATVWLLDAQGNHSGQSPTFGPFGDWRAVDIATGSDNATRVLWRNGAGQATVWLLDAQGNYTTQGATYGPYDGWTAQRIGAGADGRTRLLWTHTSGQATVWLLDAQGSYSGQSPTYGPYNAPAQSALLAKRTHVSKSPVRLSSAVASRKPCQIVLTFTGALSGATDVTHYIVQVNRKQVEVERAVYSSARYSITLYFDAEIFDQNDHITVQYSGLLDSQKRAVEGTADPILVR